MVKKKNIKKLGDFRDRMTDNVLVAKEKIIHAKDKVMEKATEARQGIEKAAKRTGRYIDKNPRKAVAIAAGVGAVIGAALIAGTRKKKGFFN